MDSLPCKNVIEPFHSHFSWNNDMYTMLCILYTCILVDRVYIKMQMSICKFVKNWKWSSIPSSYNLMMDCRLMLHVFQSTIIRLDKENQWQVLCLSNFLQLIYLYCEDTSRIFQLAKNVCMIEMVITNISGSYFLCHHESHEVCYGPDLVKQGFAFILTLDLYLNFKLLWYSILHLLW